MLKRITYALLVLLFIGFIVFFVWSQITSRADSDALAKVRLNPAIKTTETDHSFILDPAGVAAPVGLVFIPGGKIDPKAYEYKLSGLVESLGMTVVITKPYFNLAVLDPRPFETFTNDVSSVNEWVVGGHSLGGVRACGYAADIRNDLKGLLLLAAYCEKSVGIVSLSLRGENDGLVSEDDIKGNLSFLGDNAEYYEIEGANHASFGDYGMQEGDGEAAINREDMRDAMTGYVARWAAIY